MLTGNKSTKTDKGASATTDKKQSACELYLFTSVSENIIFPQNLSPFIGYVTFL